MVSIDIVGFDLKVTISGWDAVWALRRTLTDLKDPLVLDVVRSGDELVLREKAIK